MNPYINASGNSNVDAYELGIDFIKVAFSNGYVYTYTYDSTGQENVDEMKVLAESGSGLSSFINKNVKELYADVE